MDFRKQCEEIEIMVKFDTGYRLKLSRLHNDMIDRITELETALADTERMLREERDKNFSLSC